MSHSQASAGGTTSTTHETYRPTDGNFLDFQAAVMTALKAVTTDGLGRSAWKSLGLSIVTGPQYASLSEPKQAVHDNCDALILKMVRAHLHPSDRWRIAKFAVNRKVNILPPDADNEADEDDEGDRDVSMIDPTAPAWWCSPGRAAFDYLETKFAGAKDHLSKARTAVYKVSLADYRGRLPEFEAAFEALRNTYEKAVVDRGAEDPATADNLLASHLADMFDQYDHDLYGDSCKDARRHPASLTCEDFMGWARSDYDAKVKRQPAAQPPGVGDKVLVSEAPAWFLPYAHAFAMKTKVKALSTTGTPAPKWAGPEDPADRALFERCKQHGCCFNFLKDRCRRQKCRWKHAPPPAAASARANVVTDSGVSTQVTLLATDAGPLFSAQSVDDMPDATGVFTPSVCPLSGSGGLSGVFNDTGVAVEPSTVLGIYDGVLIHGQDEFLELYPGPHDAHYVMEVARDVWVDASSPEFSNWTREILHVAEPLPGSGPGTPAPNCAFMLQDGVVYVVSTRHIPCHAQLSADYGPDFFFPPQDPALSPLPGRAPFPHSCGNPAHGEVAASASHEVPAAPASAPSACAAARPDRGPAQSTPPPTPPPACACDLCTLPVTENSDHCTLCSDALCTYCGECQWHTQDDTCPEHMSSARVRAAISNAAAVGRQTATVTVTEGKRELEEGEDDGSTGATSPPPTSSSCPAPATPPAANARGGDPPPRSTRASTTTSMTPTKASPPPPTSPLMPPRSPLTAPCRRPSGSRSHTTPSADVRRQPPPVGQPLSPARTPSTLSVARLTCGSRC